MPDRHAHTGKGLLSFRGNRPVAIMLGLSVLLLVLAITIAVLGVRQLNDSSGRVDHTLRVQNSINRLAAFNERIETARRGYLLVPQVSFVNILRTTTAQFETELEELTILTADNRRQGERLAAIRALQNERDGLLSDVIMSPLGAAAAMREGGVDRDRGVVITRTIRAQTTRMADEEAELLLQRNAAQTRSLNRLYWMGSISTLLLTAFLVAVIVLVLRYNRELSRAQQSLRHANDGLEHAVASRTAELTRANQEIQRFAYIVSHDLRSPLVNVLGFTAELDEARGTVRAYLERVFAEQPALRDEATWLAVDEDLPEALGFIRKSTEKMDRLINSILDLSRQGRRTLAPELLDMNVVADGVVASLQQRADQAGAEVVVEPIPPLTSDRVAVEQILSNLVENALKYLDPKRPGRVEISGHQAGDTVRIAVKDNGRGIDPADHQRVFDLFRRAGTQDQPGEGIGLANVRALAYRLGGNVELQSRLGEGATFTVSLPTTFAPLDAAP